MGGDSSGQQRGSARTTATTAKDRGGEPRARCGGRCRGQAKVGASGVGSFPGFSAPPKAALSYPGWSGRRARAKLACAWPSPSLPLDMRCKSIIERVFGCILGDEYRGARPAGSPDGGDHW